MDKDFMFEVHLFEGELEDQTQVTRSNPVMAGVSEESLQ